MRKISSIFILFTFIFANAQHTKDSLQISRTIDNWHKAASISDKKTYFSILNKDGIFIGTDETEHWTNELMQEKVKKAFEGKSAWNFIPKKRHIFFSKHSQNIAWFDELLDTWMGVCQGSGVMERENGEWRISHYQLSIAVPNDLVKKYLELLNNNKK